MTEIINYIKDNPSGFLAIVAALIGGLFGLSIYRRNKARDYRKKLFDAFSPSLNRILQTDEDCRVILTNDAYFRHKIAVNNLMPHLGFLERIRFKRKWSSLTKLKVAKNNYAEGYTQYSDCGALNKRRKIRPIVIKRIQDVISFANK